MTLNTKITKAKVWQGAPLAMILKACMGLFMPVIGGSDADESAASLQGSRIPENFRVQLTPMKVLSCLQNKACTIRKG
jgi:hypothetical protein